MHNWNKKSIFKKKIAYIKKVQSIIFLFKLIEQEKSEHYNHTTHKTISSSKLEVQTITTLNVKVHTTKIGEDNRFEYSSPTPDTIYITYGRNKRD